MSKSHWEQVYSNKSPDDVSWYQLHPELSLNLIKSASPAPCSAIIDIGAGASSLVDELLNQGYSRLTALELSATAIELSRSRLGEHADRVTWIESNVLDAELPEHAFDVWHDRAVFHFLTQAEQRQSYIRQLQRSLKSDGTVIIATFAIDGPEKCSNLPVIRYNAEGLCSELGSGFDLIHQQKELHMTPWGSEQPFLYCCFKRLAVPL